MSAGTLSASPTELARYHFEIGARCALLLGVLVLCQFGSLPVWALVLTNVVVYPGIYLRMHDIGHASSFKDFGLVARFVPVSNPLWGGTRVFALVHRDHHRYMGTDCDPWLPYYTGHPLRAMGFNLIELEYTLREFVRRRGVDAELARNVGFNLALLVAGGAVFQWLYVVHVLSQRVVHMLGIFFFNFYTHRASFRADAPIGVWCRAESLARFLPLLRFVWGRHTIDGLIYHDRHHGIGQMHVPVDRYPLLAETQEFSRFQTTWPIAEVKPLKGRRLEPGGSVT